MKKIRIMQVLAVAVCAAAAVSAFAADGGLDTTFGVGGVTNTDFTGTEDHLTDLAVQADGKIVAVGLSAQGGDSWQFALARYNTDGTLDTGGFGSGGKALFSVGTAYDGAHAVALQPDGKIVVGGRVFADGGHDFGVIRVKADGSGLDSTFDSDGRVLTPVRPGADNGCMDILLQPDGKIVACGWSDDGADVRIGVVRYDPDGSLDGAFGSGGIVTTLIGSEASDAYALAIQADGKLVVAGRDSTAGVGDFAVVRYNTDGSLDGTFGSGGTVATAVGPGEDAAMAVAIQADGKILVGGRAHNGSHYDIALVRYLSNGSLDASFGTGGKVTHAPGLEYLYVRDLCIQPDGRIIAVGDGTGYDPAVVRFLPDGSIDASFGTAGVFTTDTGFEDHVWAAALQLDGKLIVGGHFIIGVGQDDFLCFRLNAFDTILFEDFESDYGEGDAITDYHGWQGDGVAVVKASAAHSGTFGGHLPYGSVTNLHGAGETDVVWNDLYAQVHFHDETNHPPVGAGETSVFYFDTNGYAVVYEGVTSDWQSVTNDAVGSVVTPVGTGQWVRVSVVQHYQSKTWALMLDDHVVAQQLGFADNSVAASTAFAVANATAFDDLSISRDYPRSLTGDNTDGDGLRDAWELHFFGTVGYAALDDPDGDGAPNIVEQNAGTDPTDPGSFPKRPGTVFRLM